MAIHHDQRRADFRIELDEFETWLLTARSVQERTVAAYTARIKGFRGLACCVDRGYVAVVDGADGDRVCEPGRHARVEGMDAAYADGDAALVPAVLPQYGPNASEPCWRRVASRLRVAVNDPWPDSYRDDRAAVRESRPPFTQVAAGPDDSASADRAGAASLRDCPVGAR